MRLIGIEPMTYRLGGGCSILLSYKRKKNRIVVKNDYSIIGRIAYKVNDPSNRPRSLLVIS